MREPAGSTQNGRNDGTDDTFAAGVRATDVRRAAKLCRLEVERAVEQWARRWQTAEDGACGVEDGGCEPADDERPRWMAGLFDRSMDKPIYGSVKDRGPTILSGVERQVLEQGRRNAELECGQRERDRPPPSSGTWWEDVVDLRSTREFCAFLEQRPQLKRPEYLVRAGMFEDADRTTVEQRL